MPTALQPQSDLLLLMQVILRPMEKKLADKKQRIKLGLSLMATQIQGRYRIGARTSMATITTAHDRSTLTGWAQSHSDSSNPELLHALSAAHLLTEGDEFVRPPTRREGAILNRDLSGQQVIARTEPEVAQAQWSRPGRTAAHIDQRSAYPIRISGRNRSATILYRLLRASGCTVIFADLHERPAIGDLDIGLAHFQMSDLGGNFYQSLEQATTPLFEGDQARRAPGLHIPVLHIPVLHIPVLHIPVLHIPVLHIHCGDIDIDDLLDWMNARTPHILAFPPIAGEVAISPLTIAGSTPCLRCMHLFELDTYGFSRQERIPLTEVGDSPMVLADAVATALAFLAIAFVDRCALGEDSESAPGVGEITYIDCVDIRKPQVVAISRHPLCGCSYFQ